VEVLIMPRIPYAKPEDMSEATRAAVEKAPINVMRMLAGTSPAIFDAYGKYAAAFFAPGGLPPDLRELAILRVGYLSHADYETNGHEAFARKVGLDDSHIAAIRHGGQHPDTFSPAQQAVLDFTDDVVLHVRASDAALAAARTQLGDRQTLDLIMLIGLYMTVCRLLETTGVEADAVPPAKMGITLPGVTK
jgi:alkylhydroperoxidase family enzyme